MKFTYIASIIANDDYTKFYSGNQLPSIAATKFNRLLAEGLQLNNHEVTFLNPRVISRRFSKKLFVKNSLDKTREGLLVHNLFTVNFPIIRHLVVFLNILFSILVQSKDNIIIVDYLNITSSLAACIVAKIRKMKLITVITDFSRHIPNSGAMTNRLAGHILKSANIHVALTSKMLDELKPLGIPGLVIEGLYDLDNTFEFVDYSKRDKRYLMYSGSLNEIYGIITLIEAFTSVASENDFLYLSGSGDLTDRILSISIIDSRIVYLGMLTSEVNRQYLMNAFALINPRPINDEYTLYSFPSKTIDYLGSGTITISTRLPGIPHEYWDHLYACGDTKEEISLAISQVFKLPLSDMNSRAKKGKAFVQNTKNTVVQTRRLIELINDLKWMEQQ